MPFVGFCSRVDFDSSRNKLGSIHRYDRLSPGNGTVKAPLHWRFIKKSTPDANIRSKGWLEIIFAPQYSYQFSKTIGMTGRAGSPLPAAFANRRTQVYHDGAHGVTRPTHRPMVIENWYQIHDTDRVFGKGHRKSISNPLSPERRWIPCGLYCCRGCPLFHFGVRRWFGRAMGRFSMAFAWRPQS